LGRSLYLQSLSRKITVETLSTSSLTLDIPADAAS
jgi:hypothetical protein